MKTLITTIAALTLSTAAVATPPQVLNGPLVLDLRPLSIGYAGGPSVVGSTGAVGSFQYSTDDAQLAEAETLAPANTVESPKLFVKGAEEQEDGFAAGSITTTAQNSINSAVIDVTATGSSNTLGAVLNIQDAGWGQQSAHASTEGRHGYYRYVRGYGSQRGHYVWVPAVRVTGGDISTTAVNFMNTSDISVDASSSDYDSLAVVANVQMASESVQEATADTVLVESYGDITTTAANVLNSSTISVYAGNYSSHGSATAAAVNYQEAYWATQSAEAVTDWSSTHGGDISTIALNSINTVNFYSYGGDLALGLSAQISTGAMQSAEALTVGVSTWGGDLSTAASNSINAANITVGGSSVPSSPSSVE